MRCDAARRAIFDLAAGQPPDAELAAHLAECAVCAEEYAADRSVHKALRNAPWPRPGLAPEWQPSRRVGAPSGPVQGRAERMLPRSAGQRRVASIAMVGAMLAVLVIGLGAVVVRTRTDLAVGGRDALAGAGGTNAPGDGGSRCGLLARLLGDRACRAQAPDASYWRQLAPVGAPPGRGDGSNRAFGYDEVNNRLVIFGGITTDGTLLNDTWVLVGADGTQRTPHWTELATVDPPPPRHHHAAAYDPGSNRLILYGGCLGRCFPIDDRVFVLSNANGLGGTAVWAELTTTGGPPDARADHVITYDRDSNRLIVFGGNDGLTPRFNDTWILTDANGLGGVPTWTPLAPAGKIPPRLANPSAMYDHDRNRLIVFGEPAPGGEDTDIWVLAHANGLGGQPTWTRVSPDRTSPFGNGALDAAGNRMFVFGGFGPSGMWNNVWELSHANGLGGTPTWTGRTPGGPAPSPRSRVVLAYRHSTNILVVFGGDTTTGHPNDVWALHCGPSDRPPSAGPD